MKLNKKVADDKLTEAEEEIKPEEKKEPELSKAEATAPISTDQSTAEIAKDLAAHIEGASEGEKTVAPAAAKAMATEVKAAADTLDAKTVAVVTDEDEDVIGVDNELTYVLDWALDSALDSRQQNETPHANVLVTGLPGSGKTASVYDWAAHTSPKVNIFSINAKNNDLDAYINGYTVRSADDPSKVTNAFSNNLDPLERPNSILLLDEYNRQVKPQIRASLLTLINEHTIAGNDQGRHKFKNLLFTIGCINPSIPTDPGAAPLIDAESSRFTFQLDYDSDPAVTIDYLKKKYDYKISKLNPKDDNYKKFLEQYLRIQDLGIYICSHKSFLYDTRNDLDDLADQHAEMLNQRSLTFGLVDAAKGNLDKFKAWVERFSRFLGKDKEMLRRILADYVVPSFEDLCKAKKINLDTGEISPDTAAQQKQTDPATKEADNIEDDGSFFSQPATAGSARTVSPAIAIDNIKGALASWPKF